MNKKLILGMIVSLICFMGPAECFAAAGLKADAYLDWPQDGDIASLALRCNIKNTAQRSVSFYLAGHDYAYWLGANARPGKSKVRGGSQAFTLKAGESRNVLNLSLFIPAGVTFMNFVREGFLDVKVEGALLLEDDKGSPFELPFEKATTLYLKQSKDDKSAASPRVQRVNLRIDKLMDPSGGIQGITANMGITINNPNPVAVGLVNLNYKLYYKKDKKWVDLFTGMVGGSTSIKPMGSHLLSVKRRIKDQETIRDLLGKSPTDVNVEGEAFFVVREKGWSPIYFEPAFEAALRVKNGTGMTEKVKQILPGAAAAPAGGPKVPADYKWYHDKKTNYDIAYPGDWEEIPVAKTAGQEDIISAASFIQLKENAIVAVIVKSETQKDIEEYNKDLINQFGGLLKEGEIVVNGRKGSEIVYVIPFSEEFKLKTRAVVFIVGDKSYRIACTIHEKKYAEYKAAFNNVINSFVVEE